jgi:hypothetical protein
MCIGFFFLSNLTCQEVLNELLKGTSLRSKPLKIQNLNFLHRPADELETERYAKDNVEIYSKMNWKSYFPFVLFLARFEC